MLSFPSHSNFAASLLLACKPTKLSEGLVFAIEPPISDRSWLCITAYQCAECGRPFYMCEKTSSFEPLCWWAHSQSDSQTVTRDGCAVCKRPLNCIMQMLSNGQTLCIVKSTISPSLSLSLFRYLLLATDQKPHLINICVFAIVDCRKLLHRLSTCVFFLPLPLTASSFRLIACAPSHSRSIPILVQLFCLVCSFHFRRL